MLNITIAYMNMSKKIKYVKRKNYYNLNHKFYCMRVCVRFSRMSMRQSLHDSSFIF